MRSLLHKPSIVVLSFLLSAVFLLSRGSAAGAATPPDFPIPAGHFYTEANGAGGAGGTGYAILDAYQAWPGVAVFIPFDSAFRQHGGVSALGYPASRVVVFPDFPIQVCQKLILQYQPGRGVFFLNTFDLLHDRGYDAYLESVRSIPPPFDTSPDRQLPNFAAVTARHLAFLDTDPAIRARYFAVSDPIGEYGLPMSYKDFGNVFVVRAQRAAFQHWKADVGPNKAGSVTIVNGGDIGKEVGLFPNVAVIPEGPPSFSDNILVVSPGANVTLHSPIPIGGYARLFEAQGNYELRGGTGQILASGTFHAAVGTSPDFARFDVTVPYSVTSPQPGTLTVFSISPKDGSRINTVNVPLTLLP